MRVLLRADASTAVGIGHVMRCLALAQALNDAGHRVTLASVMLPPALHRRFDAEGVRVMRVDANPGSANDAEATAAIGESGYDWAVIDGYRFTQAFLDRLETVPRRMVIDDLGLNSLEASLVLNANVYASPALYPDVDPSCDVLLGPRYTLLRREFRGIALRLPSRDLRRILVSLGGSDPTNVTPTVVRGLAMAGTAARVRVILGSEHPDPRAVQDAADSAGFQVVRDARTMLEHLTWADLVIGAGGTSGLEYACVGVPAILLVLADNQVASTRGLADAGVAISIGEPGPDLADRVRVATTALAKEPDRRIGMARRGPELVDGAGARRVVQAMTVPQIRLRVATADDADLLLRWANDPEVRAASFSSELIGPDEHRRWMQRRMGHPQGRLWLAETLGGPVGVTRFDYDGARAVISVTVAPEARGQGLGRALIGLATRRLMSELPIREVKAWVKPENRSSVAAFEGAGYRARVVADRPAGIPPDARLFVYDVERG